jgi:sulfatase modifying factor 1
MKYALAFAIAFALFLPLPVAAITIDTVPVGNPGNAGRVETGVGIFGAVSTAYRIATTEVTNSQYVAFLNAVAASDAVALYNTNMGFTSRGGILRTGSSGSYAYSVKPDVPDGGPGGTNYTYGDKPVVFVSWFDAARFANWMNNGQPSGPQSSTTTEGGAYTLNGSNPVAVARNTNVTWFIPTENQWYKSAYYDGVSNLYYNYATKSSIAPNNNIPINDSGNSANYFADAFTQQESYPLTPVGAYAASKSPYGTADQDGNVWEWTETTGTTTSVRIRRGGAFDTDATKLVSSYRESLSPTFEIEDMGFRLATISTPVGVPGDYNANNVVDAADYVLWRKYLNQPAVTLPNDSTPGTMPEDYTVWRAHFGQTSPGSGSGSLLSASVPEPATMPLFVALVATAILRRASRRSPRICLSRG